MELLPQFSRSKKVRPTKKSIRSELGMAFSTILREDTRKSKRQLVMLELNILSALEHKPRVRGRTKKIFNGFRSFLDELEK